MRRLTQSRWRCAGRLVVRSFAHRPFLLQEVNTVAHISTDLSACVCPCSELERAFGLLDQYEADTSLMPSRRVYHALIKACASRRDYYTKVGASQQHHLQLVFQFSSVPSGLRVSIRAFGSK